MYRRIAGSCEVKLPRQRREETVAKHEKGPERAKGPILPSRVAVAVAVAVDLLAHGQCGW